MQKQTWKTIDGVEISNLGNVKRNGVPVNFKCTDTFGYYMITIKNKDGKWVAKRVHRLVAEAFILNPDNKREVNHIDGNPKNNAVLNLEWVTHRENMAHARNTGLNLHRGERHNWNRLKEHEVREIWKMSFVYGLTNRLIAKTCGVSRGTVSAIHTRKIWRHLIMEPNL